MTPFRSETLDNGVVVDFFDLSNRYFGDYHRVCVEVRLTVPLAEGNVPAPEAQTDLPKVLQRIKKLERMGVAGAEVETVRERLVVDFLRHAGRYLTLPDYPARLAVANNTTLLRLRRPHAD